MNFGGPGYSNLKKKNNNSQKQKKTRENLDFQSNFSYAP